jgi:hypothetical protein
MRERSPTPGSGNQTGSNESMARASSFFARGAFSACLLCIWLVAGAPDVAAEPRLYIELNRLEPVDGQCLVYMVVTNDTPHRFEAFDIDLVFFDRNGIIASRLLFDAGRLRPNKTTVHQFTAESVRCERIEKVLLNDIPACPTAQPSNSSAIDCLALVALGTKTRVAFVR